MIFNKETLKDIIEWDVRNWSVALKFWERESSVNLRGKRALEIAGGGGGLSLWLALKGAYVICSDLNGPFDKAKILHERYKVAHLIEYRAIDAAEIPYGDGTFDVVTFKSALGGIARNNNIERERRTLKEIYRVLKIGGELYFAENLIGTSLHRFLREKFIKWGRSWRYVSIYEMKEFLSQFSSCKYSTYGYLGLFGRSEWQRNLLGCIDAMLNPFIPSSWKYIIFGVARK